MRLGLIAIAPLLLLAAACGGDGNDKTATPVRTTSSSAVPTSVGTRVPTVTPEPEGTRVDGAVESPITALKRQLEFLNHGQLTQEYAELHPGQQAIVSLSAFQRCLGPNSFQIDSIDVTQVTDEAISATGVPEKTAKGVSATLTSGAQMQDRRFFEVLVEGRWRWVFDNSAIEKYRAGDCP